MAYRLLGATSVRIDEKKSKLYMNLETDYMEVNVKTK